jgi:hypothetical protein
MDELIAKLMAAAGIGEDAAKKAVGLILGFIEKEAPQLHLDKVVAAFPSIGELISAQASAADASGGFMGKLGGMLGGAGGDLMTVIGRLTNEAGLSPGQIETVGKEIVAFLRSKLGDDTVAKMMAAIPALSKFA